MATAVAALAAAALIPARVEAGEPVRHGSIQIVYEPPTEPAHQKPYEMVTRRQSLEMLQRVFAAFQLPENLYIKMGGCNGIPNAYFFREDHRPTILVCYEYLHDVYEMLPTDPTPEGITPEDALCGQLLFAVAHEFGHAVFDIYNLPLLGRQEDAADQFAIHFLLQFGGERAQKLIWGAAYAYNRHIKNYKDNPKVTLPLLAFSNEHGSAEQRFYNLICIAYGYDSKIFATVVENGYLPDARAKVCRYEYSSLANAIKKLIAPHIDPAEAAKIYAPKSTARACEKHRNETADGPRTRRGLEVSDVQKVRGISPFPAAWSGAGRQR